MATGYKINKKDIGKLLDQWQRELAIVLPSRASGAVMMAPWDGKDISFIDWYRNTVVPPKASLFPPLEEMFGFDKDNDGFNLQLPQDEHKQLIFGIRPCDARALAILDMTFDDGYPDPYYQQKRRNTMLVGLGCTRPGESCFCTSLGIHPAESEDVDLMLTDIGDQFLIETVTETGKQLLAATSGVEKATADDEAKAGETRKQAQARVTRKLETKDLDKELLASFEDSEYWEKAAAKCISCGICTFLCPTCYCFDINDEAFRQRGVRCRNWDSCAFPVYTKMPMENPREEKWQRVRQKVCHKYEFYPMNFGVIACTGCGRCIRQCPVNWDITETLNCLPA